MRTPKRFEEPAEAFAHLMAMLQPLRRRSQVGVKALQQFQGQVGIRPGVVEHSMVCGRCDLP